VDTCLAITYLSAERGALELLLDLLHFALDIDFSWGALEADEHEDALLHVCL
jgi:hypothetical protein